MRHALTLKPLLKRGALVAAANWEVMVFQFVAETGFKLLLAIPVVVAAFLVALIVGGSAVDLAGRDVRQIITLVIGALGEHAGALVAYVLGVGVLLLGGAAFTFLVKGGTVAVLVRAEARAPAVEQPPLRAAIVRRAGAFDLERFVADCRRFFRRYLLLGAWLLAAYAFLGAAYLVAVWPTYRLLAGTPLVVGWTLVASVLSGTLVLAITLVNLLYLFVQLVVAAENCTVRQAVGRVAAFLRCEYRDVTVIFVTMLIVVALATAASILATAGLGFIGFIPIVGLTVLPLQLAAWLARGLMFQYLGLTALCAYVRLYRGSRDSATPRRTLSTPVMGRTA